MSINVHAFDLYKSNRQLIFSCITIYLWSFKRNILIYKHVGMWYRSYNKRPVVFVFVFVLRTQHWSLEICVILFANQVCWKRNINTCGMNAKLSDRERCSLSCQCITNWWSIHQCSQFYLILCFVFFRLCALFYFIYLFFPARWIDRCVLQTEFLSQTNCL